MSQVTARLNSMVNVSNWRLAWQKASTIDKIYWVLRIAVAGEFYGHGAYGFLLGGRPQWVPYFEVVGLSSATAYKLMPLIGVADVTVATIALLFPVRIILLYAAIWGFWTALLRPLAGEGIWQLVERAYNFGVPFTLLYLSGWGHGARTWLTERVRAFLTRDKATKLIWLLRSIIAAYLIGHGGLGIFDHAPNWFNYFGVLGISSATVSNLSLITLVGIFEIILGVAVFLKPTSYLLWFVFAWKVFTEFLRIPAGEYVFEFFERSGSYAAPVALLYLMMWVQKTQPSEETFPASNAAVPNL